ncbi:ABC transporter transmembrane domain-containing protein [Streptomyces sp. NPDC059629]|uniref:ABC transporter transmembrane domain-containing protein n=1 Tax=Streptomyces sp. NPDC059629 TaxID=3346889 RepID=UPI0036CA2361
MQLLNTAVSLLFFAGATLWLRWEPALCAFAAAPVLWVGTRRLSRPIRTLSRAELDRYGELVDALDENLANMRVVQAYNRQDTERDRVHRRGADRMRSSLARARLANAYACLPLADIVESVSVLAVVGAGAWEIAAGRLTVGGLLAFAAYFYPQVQALGGLAVSISSATTACKRLFQVLDTRPAVTRNAPRADGDARPAAGTTPRSWSWTSRRRAWTPSPAAV